MDQSNRVDKAIQLFEDGNLRGAETEFIQVLFDDPDNLDAHFELARIYWRLGEFERAVYHGRRVLRLNPSERNACLNLGLAYEAMGRFNLAVKYYKRELRRYPWSGETLFNLGQLYYERERWQLASKYLGECFKLGYAFQLRELVDHLGYCYYKLHDINSYIDLYRRYLERRPCAGWAQANLGAALLAVKDYRGAVLKLTLAQGLGAAHSVEGKLALAREHFRMEFGGSS